MLPIPTPERSGLDQRLGIKSSIVKPRALVSGVILLWVGMMLPSELQYADINSDDSEKLLIDPSVLSQIEGRLSSIGQLPIDFKSKIENCPIFSTQMEHLQVALELIWKLCSVSFVEKSLAGSAERSGGKRRLKCLKFSIFMDLLYGVLTKEDGSINPDILPVLLAWLDEGSFGGELEQKLIRHLSIFTEDTSMRLENGGESLDFQQEGIYQALLGDGVDSVELGDGEKKGPLRIFNNIFKANLNPHLQMSGSSVTLKGKNREFEEYQKRVSNYLNIVARAKTVTYEPEIHNSEGVRESIETNFPLNWIIYGAPGTGKSHFLDEKSDELAPYEITRVTFFSDYTYGQFVGGFRPAPLYDPSLTKNYVGRDNAEEKRPGSPIIEYRFVPGPFLKIFEKATKAFKTDPNKKFLLIIEELNRADAPAVFGDIFQLLDRKKDGFSKYPVRLSTEASEYLQANGLNPAIVLPPNLYIWATLNNADQGVLPLDTAFKRRWSFSYMGLNAAASVIAGLKIPTKFQSESGVSMELEWNELRNKINIEFSKLRVHEDMHIGPFFLSSSELTDDTAFKYKLIAYIRDDILRHRSDEFFNIPGATLSDLLDAYEGGRNIFKFSL